MEVVIENPADSNPVITPTINSGFGTLPASSSNRSYRTLPNIDGTPSIAPSYYGTLPLRTRSSHHEIPQMDIDLTTGRRIDKSGLLEIVEPDPSRSCRPRHLTGAENPSHSGAGSLTRRIDRLGLLEAVPEIPDQLQDLKSADLCNVKTTSDSQNRSIADRHLTGAEINLKDKPDYPNLNLSPRASIVSIRPSIKQDDSRTSTPSSLHGAQSSSPYFHRGHTSPIPSANGTSVLSNNSEESVDTRRGQVADVALTNKFLSDTLDSRGQPYVDLTGATYTRACVNSPIVISSRLSSDQFSDCSSKSPKPMNEPIHHQRQQQQQQKQQPPDCLRRLNQKIKDDRNSPLTVPSIPDVIEVHGSRSTTLNSNITEEMPKGERAEAEGCEHTSIENLEEGRVSFKSSNKIQHNDNVQTLRVIILSEQL